MEPIALNCDDEVKLRYVMQDGPLNERKIVKLCEYAAKNPFRIPKVVTLSTLCMFC